jgi:hypothetical protein
MGLGYRLSHLLPPKNPRRQLAAINVMNRFDPTKAHAVPRSVALCDEVYPGRHGRIDPFVGG